jgi:integrase
MSRPPFGSVTQTEPANTHARVGSLAATTPDTTPKRAPLSRRQALATDAPPPDLRAAPTRVVLPLTFGELVDLYFAAKPCAHTEGSFKKWRTWFQLENVGAWDVTAERLAIGAEYLRNTKDYKDSTVNRELSQLGSIYRWAIAQKHSPAGFISPTRGASGRVKEKPRYVEPPKPGEWDRIRKLARGFRDPKFTLFVWLIMDTGARRGEISDRLWSDFDLDAPEGPSVTLRDVDTKTGKARRLYFSHDTAALLRRLRPGSEKYREQLVFLSARGVAPNKYRKPWARLCELLGRPELHLHDMRHLLAADLLKAGKGVSPVSSLLGNSTLILHRRYGHLDDASIREIQADRFDTKAVEYAPVVEARARHAQRQAEIGGGAIAEAERLAILAQDAAVAAEAAARALAAAQAAMKRAAMLTTPAPILAPGLPLAERV